MRNDGLCADAWSRALGRALAHLVVSHYGRLDGGACPRQRRGTAQCTRLACVSGLPTGCTVSAEAYGAQIIGAPLVPLAKVAAVVLPAGRTNTADSISAGAMGDVLTTGAVTGSAGACRD
jgi:hypothetical protein